MGSEVPEFCLKWNNHHSVLISVLDTLLEREKLVDVTLAAEGQFVNVHRLVLFACSQYFEDLLGQLPDKPAVVFLKDVGFNNLKALVEYMYKGEVNVSQDELAAFLETAEALKIKGLVDKEQDKSNVGHSEPQVPHQKPKQQKQKVLRVNTVSQPNVKPVKKMSISVIAPDFVKSIQKTPAAPTKSVAIEQPKDFQESALSLEQDMMESDENCVSFAPEPKGEVTEFNLEKDQFEATEHYTQDAEGEVSRDEMSGTHSGTDNSQANPYEAELEHNSDDPANLTAGPSRPKRKATTPPATRGNEQSGFLRPQKSNQTRATTGGAPCTQKRFTCTCGRQFAHKSTHKRHLTYQCGKEPSFRCPFPNCSAAFYQKWHWKQHQLNFHKID